VESFDIPKHCNTKPGAGMKELITNGTHARILDKSGITKFAYKDPANIRINDPSAAAHQDSSGASPDVIAVGTVRVGR
jgi:hypothetical protein